jgi:hypothetical protein
LRASNPESDDTKKQKSSTTKPENDEVRMNEMVDLIAHMVTHKHIADRRNNPNYDSDEDPDYIAVRKASRKDTDDIIESNRYIPASESQIFEFWQLVHSEDRQHYFIFRNAAVRILISLMDNPNSDFATAREISSSYDEIDYFYSPEHHKLVKAIKDNRVTSIYSIIRQNKS